MSIAYRCDCCGEIIPGTLSVKTPFGPRHITVQLKFCESYDLCIKCMREKLDYVWKENVSPKSGKLNEGIIE